MLEYYSGTIHSQKMETYPSASQLLNKLNTVWYNYKMKYITMRKNTKKIDDS